VTGGPGHGLQNHRLPDRNRGSGPIWPVFCADAFGFWPYMAICGGLTAFMVIAAVTWDWHEARR
jgi:hypothetical protein